MTSRYRLFPLLALLSSPACKGSPAAEAAVDVQQQVAVSAPVAQCATQTKEMKSYLAKVFDPAVQSVPAPWPTGDAVRDRQIEVFRMTMRALTAIRDLPAITKKAELSEGIKPGALEYAIASCKPALDQLVRVGKVHPQLARQTMVEIADAISTCQCNVDVPLVTALLYLGERGPA